MARHEDSSTRSGTARVLDHDEVEGVLSGAFYTPDATPSERPSRTRLRGAAAAEKPAHYKVICISMYTKDLARMDELVEVLKAKGMTKASRSALIRAALEQVDLDKIPRGM
jgi:hypothetical protein